MDKAISFSRQSPYLDGTTWGPWTFHASNLTLSYDAWGYDINLETIDHIEEAVDWMCQLEGKGWVSAADLGYLFKALDDLLQFRTNFPSSGKPKTFAVSQFLKAKVAEAAQNAKSPDSANYQGTQFAEAQSL
jgi:hypothetical protein